MNKFLFHIITFSLVLTSCGSSKEVQEISKSTPISAKDYPYITKFHEAIRLKTKGRTDEAVAKLEECLLVRQDDDAVYYALSELELTRNNRTKSAEYILKAAELDPMNTWYIQELAYMYYEQKQFDKSAENFKKLVDIEPRNVDWQYGYAETLLKIGELGKAIDALNKTEDQVGLNPELSIQKYNLYMQMKDEENALKEIESAKEAFPKDLHLIATLVDHYFNKGKKDEGLALLKELAAADSDNGKVHLALADVYMQSGNTVEAYKSLKNAFEKPGVDEGTKMNVLMSLMESSYKIAPEALELSKLFVEHHPNSAKAHSVRGDYLLKVDDEDGALKAYQKALQFEKGEFAIWNQVLLMEYQSSQFEDLYRDSKECLELFPTIPTVYLLNGVSANQLKKFDEAVEVLAVGRELIMKDKAVEAEFLGQMGEAHFGLKENEEGKKQYKKALELDPASSLIRNNFAYRLAMADIDLELAESLIGQALEVSASQPQFLDTYGFVLFRKGEYDEALKQFEKAHELNDKDVMIVEHLGDAYIMKGNEERALELWNKALEMGSKNTALPKKIAEKQYHEPVF